MDNQDKIIKFYKKKIEPFVAIFILAFLITTVVLLVKDHNLKKEISENCGFDTEEYRCYCDKESVQNIELFLNGSLIDEVRNGNVTLVE